MDSKTPKHPKKERSFKLRLSCETLQQLEDKELREVAGGATGNSCPVITWCPC